MGTVWRKYYHLPGGKLHMTLRSVVKKFYVLLGIVWNRHRLTVFNVC